LKTSTQIEKRQLLLYILSDVASGAIAYTVLHLIRKFIVEPSLFGQEVLLKWDFKFFLGLCLTTALFIAISGLSGIYRELTRKSRLLLFFNTIGGVLITSGLLFFTVLLDDFVGTYTNYYLTLGSYTGALAFCAISSRMILSTAVRTQIDSGELSFPTVLVGGGKEAADLMAAFNKGRSKGYRFIGYMSEADTAVDPRLSNLPYIGPFEQLEDIIHDNNIEDVIIALSNGNSERIAELVSSIEDLKVRIHVLPNLFSILSGQVKMESLGRSLIEVKRELIKPHVAFIKRIFDITVASLLLCLASPFILFSMLMIAIGSKGPLFYLQERLGKHGKTFKIIKLRSMYVDAESSGPQLSSEDDPRITPWGRTMRKFRLDELPQFLNVLKGDMSIVGPRPERRFFYEQIITQAPQYKYLLRVKPGITSWGMVKFGYAENVEEMLERARYDLIYTENITLLNDIKILFYTLVIVLQGRGK
jgi:exopolysaccharide biosynthesis polyprenyl glycosylphosphotransferase